MQARRRGATAGCATARAYRNGQARRVASGRDRASDEVSRDPPTCAAACLRWLSTTGSSPPHDVGHGSRAEHAEPKRQVVRPRAACCSRSPTGPKVRPEPKSPSHADRSFAPTPPELSKSVRRHGGRLEQTAVGEDPPPASVEAFHSAVRPPSATPRCRSVAATGDRLVRDAVDVHARVGLVGAQDQIGRLRGR